MISVTKISSCFKCKYLIKCADPKFIQYSKCALFGYKDTNGDITKEFANICLKSDALCGGKHFKINDIGRHH